MLKVIFLFPLKPVVFRGIMKPKVFIGTIELIISMVKILFYIVNYQKIFFREAIDSLKPLKTIDLKGKNNTIPVDKSNI